LKSHVRCLKSKCDIDHINNFHNFILSAWKMKTDSCILCGVRSGAANKLSGEELILLDSNCGRVKFNAGDIIVKQDALSTHVVYIKSGLVKVHIRGPIRERIIRITKAPAYLCLPNNFGDKINHFSATALEDSSVCFIDVNIFKQFIHENGDFALQIIMDMSKGEIENYSNCMNNSQKQNLGRIADAILFFAERIYGSKTFILPVSRQELADLTGITRESASRILSDFHEEKIIEMNHREVTILNEKLLREISEKG
jgi:CRP-like cAMP-binding protein